MTILSAPMRPTRLALAALWALAAARAEAAVAPSPRVSDFAGPRSMGMGDAHRAVSSGNDGIYLNPAGMGQTKRYALEFVYFLNPAAPSNILNFSIVDSDTAPVATGAAYTHWSVGRRGERKSGSIFNLAFGYPLMEGVFVGWGLKYLNLDQPGDPASGAATDLSLLVRLADLVSVGVVGYNLFKVGDANNEAPIAMAMAAAVGDDRSFRLALDWQLDFSTRATTASVLRAGGEVFLGQAFPLRAGYVRDAVRGRNYLSFGGGLMAEGLGLELAYRRQVGGSESGGGDHSFAAAIKLQLK